MEFNTILNKLNVSSMKMAAEQEHMLKKKLQAFLAEMLKIGTVKGFKYFAMYMKGREELVISILNEPSNPVNTYIKDESSTRAIYSREYGVYTPSPTSSFTSNNLPYDKRSLMLSARTQMNLSGLAEQGVGLPPASPSENETTSMSENSTLFLIAGYSRYNCPYVWVRSNHDRLVRLGKENREDRDNPLRLKSTSQWIQSDDIQLWDVIIELVKLCMVPVPLNPFQVDFEYFDNLPLQEMVLATGAMVNFLQKVILNDSKDKGYTAAVLEDLHLITKKHFKALQTLIRKHGLPILEKSAKQSQANKRTTAKHMQGKTYNF